MSSSSSSSSSSPSTRRGRSRERSALSPSSRPSAVRSASHSPEPLIVTVLSFLIYLTPIVIAIALWYYLAPAHPGTDPSTLPPTTTTSQHPHTIPSAAQAG